jgi:hypothetical protein
MNINKLIEMKNIIDSRIFNFGQTKEKIKTIVSTKIAELIDFFRNIQQNELYRDETKGIFIFARFYKNHFVIYSRKKINKLAIKWKVSSIWYAYGKTHYIDFYRKRKDTIYILIEQFSRESKEYYVKVQLDYNLFISVRICEESKQTLIATEVERCLDGFESTTALLNFDEQRINALNELLENLKTFCLNKQNH